MNKIYLVSVPFILILPALFFAFLKSSAPVLVFFTLLVNSIVLMVVHRRRASIFHE